MPDDKAAARGRKPRTADKDQPATPPRAAKLHPSQPKQTAREKEAERQLWELHAEIARRALARGITTGVQHRSYRAGSRR